MSKQKRDPTLEKTSLPTVEQVSAGGVAFRSSRCGTEIAIVSIAKSDRWQLPKGIVDAGETPEVTALREVREEAGIATTLLAPIDTIEYWYVGDRQGQRVRFHKFVHFFLLAYQAGDISDHDWEVQAVRWASFSEAIERLSFKSERAVVKQAQILIERYISTIS